MFDTSNAIDADTVPADKIIYGEKPPTWRQKYLSGVFNRHALKDAAIGAALSMGASTVAKMGFIAAVGTTGAPVIAMAMATAAVGGVASGTARHITAWRKERRENPDLAPAFFSGENGKKALKTILLSTVFAGTGGAIFTALDQYFDFSGMASKAASWAKEQITTENIASSLNGIHELYAGTLSERTDIVATVSEKANSFIAGISEHIESSLEVIQGPYTGTPYEKARAIFSDINWAKNIFTFQEPALLDTPPYTDIITPTALAAPAPLVPVAPVAALTIADLPSGPAAPSPLDLSTLVPPVPAFTQWPSLQDPDLLTLANNFGGNASPATSPVAQTVAAPITTLPNVAAPASAPSFTLGQNVTNFPQTGTAPSASSFVIDPQNLPGTATAVPIPDPVASGIVLLSDADLRDSLQSVLNGRPIRPSTQALMDVAFGPADTAQEKASKAQAMKDLAFFALNGRGGVPLNPEVGLALMRSAAAAGNGQAGVDMAYIAYHGLFGVAADPAGAMNDMEALANGSRVAQNFVSAWSNAGPSAAPTFGLKL